MPRDDLLKGRVSLVNHVYHVTTVTENRRPIFADFFCGRLVVAEMRRLEAENAVRSLAWTLMPDHLHWLLQLGDRVTLSSLMQKLKGRSSQAINQHLGDNGAVWQRGFHDHALRREEDLRSIARYIVANPLRRGLVNHIGDYPLWDAIWL